MTVCVANTVAESGSPRVRRCITSVGPKQSRRRCRRCRLTRLLPGKGSDARRRPHAHRGGNSDRPARCQADRTGVIPASPKRSPDAGRRDDNRPVRGSRDARDSRKPQAGRTPRREIGRARLPALKPSHRQWRIRGHYAHPRTLARSAPWQQGPVGAAFHPTGCTTACMDAYAGLCREHVASGSRNLPWCWRELQVPELDRARSCFVVTATAATVRPARMGRFCSR